MTFSPPFFSTEILTQITTSGYTTPTPIQLQAIPPILNGSDVIGLAQTGTGKTAAFVLPILQRLSTGKHGLLRAIIVAPTRELAEQINDTIRILGKRTGLKSTTIYGGVNMKRQVDILRSGIDIVV
ncbi:DEAD/DEAH box helicase, partial [bacterium]|nr:DEAD/DEAH box helicase [bacterium]